MERENNHWDIKPLNDTGARYRMAFGERSNGKTYGVLFDHLKRWNETGEQLALIRRWESDFVGANSARTSYDSLMCNSYGVNVIEEITDGRYNGVEYYGGRYYMTQYDEKEERTKRTNDVIALSFALNNAEHYKSGSFPKVKTIFFDEFISTKDYLRDEFVLFQNICSTIIRDRDDVVIYMCGNTINMYNPYFKEMGLYKSKDMHPGDLEVYEFGESGLSVAVQYTDSPKKKKKSDIYFAFNNPKLKMITSGNWQIDIYPHCPTKYAPKNVLFEYFIIFDGDTYHAEIVSIDTLYFTYIHRKTTPIKDPYHDCIYCLEYDARPNWHRKITKPRTDLEDKIAEFFRTDKVFYQDNEVGNAIENYMSQCNTSK